MVDLFNANVRDALLQDLLCKADHNLVYLSSTYRPIVQRQPVTKTIVGRWSQEGEETVWGCFKATDWGALCQSHGNDIVD